AAVLDGGRFEAAPGVLDQLSPVWRAVDRQPAEDVGALPEERCADEVPIAVPQRRFRGLRGENRGDLDVVERSHREADAAGRHRQPVRGPITAEGALLEDDLAVDGRIDG